MGNATNTSFWRAAVGAAVALSAIAVGAAPATAQEAPAFDRVVTIGDSYASGTGIHADATSYDDQGPLVHEFAPSLDGGSIACLRELDTTPGPRVAAALGADFDMVACAGGVIDNIDAQLAVADLGSGAGSLALLTIGGNDVRTARGESWPEALIRCITAWRCDRDSGNQLSNLDDVQTRLTALYQQIGTAHPDLTLRVYGYPRLMQPGWFCSGVLGLGRSEGRFIDGQADRLNATIAAAVNAADASTPADIGFVDVVDEFDGNGACEGSSSRRGVNSIVFGNSITRTTNPDGTVSENVVDLGILPSAASFHPSQLGYDAYFDALVNNFGG
ncbi:MAG: hypothetical protein AAGF73_18770 [Actinomycetota bacterium]